MTTIANPAIWAATSRMRFPLSLISISRVLMLAVQPVSNTIQNFGPVGSTVSPIGLLRRRERSFNSEVNVSFVPLAICAQTAPVAGLILSIHSPLFGRMRYPFMKI